MQKQFGLKGEEIFLTENEKLPCLGQLTQKKFSGVNFFENNLSKTPVFINKASKNDFLLICEIKNGEKKFYLRQIRTIYTAG
jgi:hypothetical protein